MIVMTHTSVAPTSKVLKAAVLVLLIAGNETVQIWGELKWRNVHVSRESVNLFESFKISST